MSNTPFEPWEQEQITTLMNLFVTDPPSYQSFLEGRRQFLDNWSQSQLADKGRGLSERVLAYLVIPNESTDPPAYWQFQYANNTTNVTYTDEPNNQPTFKFGTPVSGQPLETTPVVVDTIDLNTGQPFGCPVAISGFFREIATNDWEADFQFQSDHHPSSPPPELPVKTPPTECVIVYRMTIPDGTQPSPSRLNGMSCDTIPANSAGHILAIGPQLPVFLGDPQGGSNSESNAYASGFFDTLHGTMVMTIYGSTANTFMMEKGKDKDKDS